MEAEERAVLEEELARACGDGDFGRAATLAVRGYGPEILGLLHALHRDGDAASDVFSSFCEDLWRGLPGFEQRASFRTWLYVIARRASQRWLRVRDRQRERHLRLGDVAAIEDVAAQVRTATLSYLRSQARTRLQAVREALPVDDQTLLILRIDRNLDWNELARVFHDDDELDEAALKRETARLRKRFQLVKDRLRARMRGGQGGDGEPTG